MNNKIIFVFTVFLTFFSFSGQAQWDGLNAYGWDWSGSNLERYGSITIRGQWYGTGVRMFSRSGSWSSSTEPGHLQLNGSKIYDNGNFLHFAGGASKVSIHSGDENSPVAITLNGQTGEIQADKLTVNTLQYQTTQVSNLNVTGNINAMDIISGGANSWIFHTPDDGRKTLYVAPVLSSGLGDWDNDFEFHNDGSLFMPGGLTVLGGIFKL